jgi:hypothetical protein
MTGAGELDQDREERKNKNKKHQKPPENQTLKNHKTTRQR